jgi:hypothetical protein
MKSLFRFGMLLLVLAFTACMFQEDDKVASGGEDFPNTVQPLGKVAALNITNQSQYFYYTGAPKVPNVVKTADSADSSAPPKLLAKRSSIAGSGDTLQNYVTTTLDSDGSVKYTLVRASPGPDGDINTHQDNIYVSYFYTRTLGTDTLEYLILKDVDGDGVFWGGPGDSGTVEMDYWAKNPSFRPLADSVSLKLLVRFYNGGDSATILSYSEYDHNKDGGVANYKAQGSQPDSVIRLANDTLLLTIDQTPGPGTSNPQSHSVYWISVGSKSKSSVDSLLFYTVDNTWTQGTIRHSTFQFTPTPHVAWKALANKGNFTMTTLDSTDVTEVMSGSYLGDSTVVDIRQTSGGKSYHYSVIYDSTGAVKLSVPLTN